MSDFRVASFSAGCVVQGASYKLQSGRWLVHQALLGLIFALHRLARGVVQDASYKLQSGGASFTRGPWYKVQSIKTIGAAVDSPSPSRLDFRVASFNAGCMVQDANYKL